MHALRVGEDAAVEDGTARAEDALQRMRGAVQIGEARPGVQTGVESDVRADSALELSPEGYGAQAAEGADRIAFPAAMMMTRVCVLRLRRYGFLSFGRVFLEVTGFGDVS